MSGDNFHFDITGAPLDKSLDIAFTEHNAIGWAEMDGEQSAKRLVLFWSDSGVTNHNVQFQRFPSPIRSVEEIEPIIKGWLKDADYGREPDHDGDNGKGWRVYNESWTHVAGMWQAFVAIEPCWIWYGK